MVNKANSDIRAFCNSTRDGRSTAFCRRPRRRQSTLLHRPANLLPFILCTAGRHSLFVDSEENLQAIFLNKQTISLTSA